MLSVKMKGMTKDSTLPGYLVKMWVIPRELLSDSMLGVEWEKTMAMHLVHHTNHKVLYN
jgi:hypothetical protein